jgi:hypothetical protein
MPGRQAGMPAPHYNRGMVQGDERFCDGCRQKLPGQSKLSRQVVQKAEAEAFGTSGDPNDDGTVTIDLCLNCRVIRSNQPKHGYS